MSDSSEINERLTLLGKQVDGYFQEHSRSHAALEAGLAVLTEKVEEVKSVAASIDARVAEQNGRIRSLEASRSAASVEIENVKEDVDKVERSLEGLPGRVRAWVMAAVAVATLLGGAISWAVHVASGGEAPALKHASGSALQPGPARQGQIGDRR